MPENNPQVDADPILTSVRKIVTRSLTEMETDAPVDAPSNVEKLLLTPALRVDEDADPAPELQPARRPRVTTRTLSAERITLEQRIAELERAVTPDGNWEPDGSEGLDQETPNHFPGLDEARVTPPPKRPSVQPELIDETVSFRSDRAASPVEQKAPEAQDPEIATPAPAPRDGQRAVERPTLELGGGMDEVALRDMVAEIVRSELQGELGERITRNVRKLVRREIYRAIMTRDFN